MFLYEDELPDDISREEYNSWFEQSWVNCVRVGPRMHFSSKKCWCNPRLEHIDPETLNEVWVHNEPH